MRRSSVPFLCRIPALAFAFAALPLTLVGVALVPPVLGRWVLAAGRVEPGMHTIVGWSLGLSLILMALLSLHRALRLWNRAAELSPKKVQFALVTVVGGGLALFGLMELVARVALTTEKVLSAEALHRYQWVDGRKNAPQGGGLNEGYPDQYAGCITQDNGLSGVFCDSGSVVINTTGFSNGSTGINSTTGTVVRGCSARFNDAKGIWVSVAGTVSGSNARENGEEGILAPSGLIHGCTSTANTGANFSGGTVIDSHP